MLITDVRAHHIRIPYDAGVASFRQGAASISALEIIMAEVSTDAGILLEIAEISTNWIDFTLYGSPLVEQSLLEKPCSTCAAGTWTLEAKNLDAAR